MLYSASNAKLKINGREILASQASISLSTSLSPKYVVGERSTTKQVASRGIGGSLNVVYYFTGKDYLRTFITGQGEVSRTDEGINPDAFAESQIISGNFGGLNFQSGYLTSYSVNFAPNSTVTANAQINFFDQLLGEFTSEDSVAVPVSEVLNFRNAQITNVENTVENVDNFIGGAYNYNSEVKPVYLMNEVIPSAVSFGQKTISMNFEVDNPTGTLPITGSFARINVSLKNSNGITQDGFLCSGVMNQRNMASVAGDYIKQTISIIQNETAKIVRVAGIEPDKQED